MSQAKQVVLNTNSPDETLKLGEALGRSFVGGITVGLVGHLGAGKTLLVKGIAVGNGGEDSGQVTSPTFTLVNEYPGRMVLYHFDAYRLPTAREFLALGFDELVRPDSAVVVEWADRVREVLPADTLWIEIASTGPTGRSFSFRAGGTVSTDCLDALRATQR